MNQPQVAGTDCGDIAIPYTALKLKVAHLNLAHTALDLITCQPGHKGAHCHEAVPASRTGSAIDWNWNTKLSKYAESNLF